jgi:hypothetical protein
MSLWCSLFYYSLFHTKLRLYVIVSLNKQFIVWWDFIIYFPWNTNYYMPTCTSENLRSFRCALIPQSLATHVVQHDKTYVLFSWLYSVSLNKYADTTIAFHGYFQFASLSWLSSAFIQVFLLLSSSTITLPSLSLLIIIHNHPDMFLAFDYYQHELSLEFIIQSPCHISCV